MPGWTMIPMNSLGSIKSTQIFKCHLESMINTCLFLLWSRAQIVYLTYYKGMETTHMVDPCFAVNWIAIA